MKRSPKCQWSASKEFSYELLAAARRRYHIERIKLEIQHRLDPIRLAIARLVHDRIPQLNAWASAVMDENDDDVFMRGFETGLRNRK